MSLSRRVLLSGAAGYCAASLDALPAKAQLLTKPVTLVIPFAPGGPADSLARLSAPMLKEKFGQMVIVDNKPGAETLVGAQLVVNAQPDGHTLLFGGSQTDLIPAVKKGVPFDPTKALVPVAGLYRTWLALQVNASLPVTNLNELIDYARAHPGKLNYCAAAVSGVLAGEAFKRAANLDIVAVPYKGAAPAARALLSGEVQVGFLSMLTTQAHIKSGKLRALAVTTDRRMSEFPELPTLIEAGYNVKMMPLLGVYAPASTPDEVIAMLNADFVEVANSKPSVDFCERSGMIPVTGSPAEIAVQLRSEISDWQRMAKLANFVPE